VYFSFFHCCYYYGSAALSLGCSLTKTSSKSQPNSQRCYLNRNTEEVRNLFHDLSMKSQYVSEHVASTSKKQCVEHQAPPNLFSVYPLYYGNNVQPYQPQHGFNVSHVSVSHTSGPTPVVGAENPLAHNFNSSSGGSQSFIFNGNLANPCTNKCDLSLRLGPSNSVPSPSFENGHIRKTEVKSKFKCWKPL